MTSADAPSIVGVWEVHAPEAPFPWHVMTFAQDGTMSQGNPPAGNRHESDSAGHGIWQIEADSGRRSRVVGKFVEMKADPHTGAYIGKGVITFEISVHGDAFAGYADAMQYDAEGHQLRPPARTTLAAMRLRFIK